MMTSVLTTADTGCCGAPLLRDPLSPAAATEMAVTLKALADPTRLRLLSIVAASDGAQACVCDLVVPLGLSQPTVSHHLKVLLDAGFLTRSKRGTWAYYTLVPEALSALSALLASP